MKIEYSDDFTPEDAINFLKSKGYKIGWSWRDVWEAEHRKAFTVAKAMQSDILEEIRTMVQESIDSGITYKKFLETLEPQLRAKGWWGKKEMVNPKTGETETVTLGTPWRLKTIYQTNLQTSYQCGNYESIVDAASAPIEPIQYLQYLAIMDSKTRPFHRSLHGKIFKFNDPIWRTIYPPNGFNCRCTVRPLTDFDLAKAGIKEEITSQGIKTTFSRGIVEDGQSVINSLSGKGIKIDEGWGYHPCAAAEHINDIVPKGAQ